MIEDFGLLSFQPLAIEDRDSVRHLAALVDKANGYVFSGLARPGGRTALVDTWDAGAGRPFRASLAGGQSASSLQGGGRSRSLPRAHAPCLALTLRAPRSRPPSGAGQPAPELQYTAGLMEDSADLWEAMQDKYVKGRDLPPIVEHAPSPPQQQQQQQQQPAPRSQQQQQEGQAGGGGGGTAVAAARPLGRPRQQQQQQQQQQQAQEPPPPPLQQGEERPGVQQPPPVS